MNKVTLNIVIDVNVFIDALQGGTAPCNIAELMHRMPILRDIAAADASVRLVDSDHILDLVEKKAIEILGYSAKDAVALVTMIQEVSNISQGAWVSIHAGGEISAEVTPWINSHCLGEGRGQIDFEDLQVLGAAAYAQRYTPNAFTLIVTRDGGIHNVAENIAPMRLGVAHVHNACRAIAAVNKATA